MEQRLNERWSRVQTKLQAKLAKQSGENETSKVIERMSAANDANECEAKVQIKESRNIVDDKAQSVEHNVSDIKLLAEMKASNRRRVCSQECESRMYRLEQCIEKSRKLNAKIDAEWNELSSIVEPRQDPQSLYARINQTKLACAELICGYESTRKQFMSEFKKKCEHYVSLLKSEESDITEMIWRMHQNMCRIKGESECQIIEIEKAFMKERRQIIESSNPVPMSVSMPMPMPMQMAIYNDASGSKLKKNLQNHIQVLEQQLEEMRAVYQLNTEKLNYNFQVLKEREKENQTSVDQLKRREKKLAQIVANTKEKFAKSEACKRQKIGVLNDEYNRVSVQYEELKRKFSHFEVTDTQKYEQICDMNRREATCVLTEVIKCDQIICAQLLGIQSECACSGIPQNIEKRQKNKNKNQSEDCKYSKEQILSVCKLLIAEAPFLGRQCDTDAILRNLGVDDIEDIEALCASFLCQTFRADKTVQTVKKFLSNRDESGISGDSNEREKQQRRKRKDVQYWKLLQSVFPSISQKTWSLLEQYLVRFIQILEKRKGEAQKITILQNQNAQLRQLLKQYLASDANKELIVPPSLNK